MNRVLLILLCFLLCNCQPFHITEILDTAERQVVEHPDSALSTMRSIRRYSILVPPIRARYGVLYSKVLDKNYIDIASDSLVRYSADYYDLYGTPEQKMESYYYLGRTQENAGKSLPATLSYLDAAQHTDNVDNNYLKGLLYSRLGEMYRSYYNYQRALDYFEASYRYYTIAHLPKHQAYQLYKIGSINASMSNIDTGILAINKAIELATESKFYDLLPYCNIELLRLYTSNGEYKQAYSTLQQLDSQYYIKHVQYLTTVILTLHKHGDRTKAKEFIDRGWNMAQNATDSCYMHHCLSQIYRFDKQYNKSINEYNKWISILNSYSIQHTIGNEIAQIENEFFQQKANSISNKATKHKRIYATIIALITVISVCILIHKHLSAKRKERQLVRKLENNIALIDDIRHSFDLQNKQMSAMLHNMSANHFLMFDEICNTYYERSHSTKLQASIYNKVQEFIDSFSHDAQTLKKIEQIINTCKDNAMLKLRKEIPSLKADEYKLLCYIFAGFSNQAIAVFTNSESGTVATRKSRLKSKIAKANTASCNQFIDLF